MLKELPFHLSSLEIHFSFSTTFCWSFHLIFFHIYIFYGLVSWAPYRMQLRTVIYENLGCFTQKEETLGSVPGTEPRTLALQVDSLPCPANLPQLPHRTELTFYVFWRNHVLLFSFAWTQARTVTEAEPWLGASRPPVGLQQPLPRAL